MFNKVIILLILVSLMFYSCNKKEETVIYNTNFSEQGNWELTSEMNGDYTASSEISNNNLLLTSKGGTAIAQFDYSSLLNNKNPEIILIEMDIPYLTCGYLMRGGKIEGFDVEVNLYHNNYKYFVIKGYYVEDRKLSFTISDNTCEIAIDSEIIKFTYDSESTNDGRSMIEFIVNSSQASSGYATESVIISTMEITTYD